MQANADAAFRRLDDIVDFICSEDKNKEYVVQQNDVIHMVMRFSTDGAKMAKNISSVRGVVKPLIPRDQLPADVSKISMSPEDEYTLYLYMGKYFAKDENNSFLVNIHLLIMSKKYYKMPGVVHVLLPQDSYFTLSSATSTEIQNRNSAKAKSYMYNLLN